jgi:hypothetical protein
MVRSCRAGSGIRQGIWPSFAPLGYKNTLGADGQRTIAPESEFGSVIHVMFERYATGKWRRRIQDRIDAIYMDKLHGRIDNGFFARKAAGFRSDQCRVMRGCWTWPAGSTSCSRISLCGKTKTA